ncbi:MAG: NUDIX domain-containing protein [bacterium]|nr:NUDIX domain-containing protein [bacterium]
MQEPPRPEHLRFAVLATDTVLITINNGELLVRLVGVNRPPHFVDAKGLPGGLLHPHETAEQATVRHLTEKAHVDASKAYIEQLYTFSNVDRDPRGRVVAVVYLALIPWEKLSAIEKTDTPESWWAPVTQAKKLAYDHDEILAVALARLRSRITYTTLINKLMPREFTLTELEHAYESILKTDLDKRNFRKKILKLGILAPLPHKKSGGRFRPAQLYRFASEKVTEIEVL